MSELRGEGVAKGMKTEFSIETVDSRESSRGTILDDSPSRCGMMAPGKDQIRIAGASWREFFYFGQEARVNRD